MRNRPLQNAHKGAACFILATGPSIRTQELLPLRDHLCIAVSNFIVHPHYATISPRYHCIAPFHPPITEQGFQAWLDEIGASAARSALFFGLTDVGRVMANEHTRDRELHFIDFQRHARLSTPVDLSRSVPGVTSVSIMALYVALHLGCSTIFLLGFDHDVVLHIGETRHFYDVRQHALMRDGYSEWQTGGGETPVEYNCRSVVALWRQYREIKRVAESSGVRIVNLTPGSLLDVFPRGEYAHVMAALERSGSGVGSL
jgi:hypothetical protein